MRSFSANNRAKRKMRNNVIINNGWFDSVFSESCILWIYISLTEYQYPSARDTSLSRTTWCRIRSVLPRKSSIRAESRDCVLRFRKVRSLSWNLSNYRLASEAFALAFIGPDKKKLEAYLSANRFFRESTAFIAPRYMEIARKDNDSLFSSSRSAGP